MKERQAHIDMAAGIMLAWMILGHVASHASYHGAFLRIGIYLSFFMPWFFYKAGMFYKLKPLKDGRIGGAKSYLRHS